jgi:hypothetical protein
MQALDERKTNRRRKVEYIDPQQVSKTTQIHNVGSSKKANRGRIQDTKRERRINKGLRES